MNTINSKNYLLDTQIALWIMLEDNKIDENKFRNRFIDSGASLIFHQVSTWEIQIKYTIGKLTLPERPESFLLKSVSDSGFSYESIDDKAIFFLDKLPDYHKDPFDRLLIAHAAVNGWTIITADQSFDKYPVNIELI